MKKSRFIEEQRVPIVREADKAPVAEVAKKHGISAQTIYNWRQHFGGLKAAEVKRLKQLEQENARLKKMVAERDLEIEVMREIGAKMYGPLRICKRVFSDDTVCVNVSGLSRVSRFWQQGHDGICALGSQ